MPQGSKPKPGPFTEAVAEILRAQKGRLQVSIAPISEQSRVKRSQLGTYLTGEKQPLLEELDRICAALHLDLIAVLKEADERAQTRKLAADWPRPV